MTGPPVRAGEVTRGGWLALALATAALVASFWAWYLIAPLAKDPFGTSLGLSSMQIGLLVAMPILVGSLGRIPAGALTDRFGGRRMFALVSFAVIVPVGFLSLGATQDSYRALLVGGFFLGLGGAVFAIGIPYVSQWFPPEKRGLALGIYGMGNVGTAVSVRFTPRLYNVAPSRPFYVVIGVLAAVGLAFIFVGKESPHRTNPEGSLRGRLGAAMKLRVTWDLAGLYAITFGAFVAFGAYLPTFFTNVWHLDRVAAGNLAALFVLTATLARPVGGWLSDRVSGATVTATALGVAAVCAAYLSVRSTPVPSAIDAATGLPSAVAVPSAVLIVFAVLASCLGLGNGAIFALAGKRADPALAGSVAGLVGAVGGFGGYMPTLVMAWVYGRWGGYAKGLVPLAVVSGIGAIYAATAVRRSNGREPEVSGIGGSPGDRG